MKVEKASRCTGSPFAWDSEMAREMSAFDWSKTPAGPVDQWPQSLCTAVRIILASQYPSVIAWGKELVNIYNDAFAPMLGPRHPSALGKSAQDVWSDIWPVIGPLVDLVFAEGRPSWRKELLLIMTRYGFIEETYFTFSFSPIPDDEGGIGGLYCACTEDTAQVVSRRRLRCLAELGAQLVEAKSTPQACELTAKALANHPHDVPFALIYLASSDGHQARLVGHAGIQPGLVASPMEVDLEAATTRPGQWPFRDVPAQGLVLKDLAERFGNLPGTPWPEPATTAMLLPISHSSQKEPVAFLVAGISPRRQFDDEYREFVGLLARQLTAGIAEARAYEDEQQKAETLAELDRAKTTFFNNISHEFRTPLTLMLGSLEELRREALPATARQEVELARRSSLRLLKLVNTLLDFARIEASRVEAVHQPTDLGVMTAELASAFRSAVEKAGMRLVVDCPSLPELVDVDRGMWEKIVLNLLSNAFKFTLEGEIDVALHPRADRVELTVHDTGTGIPESELPHIFERFHRVANPRARSVEGTGIGLALIKELVKLLDGSISVSSVVGQGTTFMVSIPADGARQHREQSGGGKRSISPATGALPYVEEALAWLPDAAKGRQPAAESSVLSEEALSLAGVHRRAQPESVLLADDNADMRQYLSDLLGRHWTVLAVANGSTALDMARQRTPELVLADVMMPGMDGFELLRQLRADFRTRNVPVILLSARAGEEAQVEGMEAGADDYLIKPFSARELVARVRSHLELTRQRRESEQALRDGEARLTAANERLEAALRASPVLVFEQDRNLRYVWARNPVLVNRPEEMLGKTDIEVFEREEDAIHMQGIKREVMKSGISKRLEVPVQIKGAVRWFDLTVQPRLEGEVIKGILATARDITAQKQFQAELERLVAERTKSLQETTAKLNDFCYSIAHDLKAPIRAQVGFADLLLDEYGERIGPLGLDYLKRVRDSAAHQARLVNDLLSHMSLDRTELPLKPVSLASTVEAAREDLHAEIQRAHAVLQIQPLDCFVLANPSSLHLVVVNLLSNALKFVAPGTKPEVSIWTEARSEDQGHSWIRLSVRDNGIGIPPESQAKIFGVFERLHSNEIYPGTGIGLAIVKRAVQRMNGRVGLESEPGKGSLFWVELPAANAADTREAAQ